jgi:hypothetical protein
VDLLLNDVGKLSGKQTIQVDWNHLFVMAGCIQWFIGLLSFRTSFAAGENAHTGRTATEVKYESSRALTGDVES